jgi:hypothetical protein
MNFSPVICNEALLPQTKKRKRRTLIEQSELVRRWKKSGVSESVFCRENAINAKAFANWLLREKKLNSKKVKQDLPGSAKRKFLDYSPNCLDCELSFPNGAVMKLPKAEFSFLLPLIREIAQCKFK